MSLKLRDRTVSYINLLAPDYGMTGPYHTIVNRQKLTLSALVRGSLNSYVWVIETNRCICVVLSSSTKYLAGHTDLVGGAVSYGNRELGAELHQMQLLLGNNMVHNT